VIEFWVQVAEALQSYTIAALDLSPDWKGVPNSGHSGTVAFISKTSSV
jgi:hypothetical protein